ncbi:MAG: metallophosphoesterase [Methylococcales bacterium]|nr:metallophosphoesterase [Methylococcales bacterium]
MSDLSRRILFAGDPHGDFQAIIEAVGQFQPEAVILLGDCELSAPLESQLGRVLDLTDVWWIPGNHDFDDHDRHRFLFASALADKNLHLNVKTIAGLRVAGLGGIFLGRVWYPPRAPRWHSKQDYLAQQPQHLRELGLSLKMRSAIWYDEVQQLKKHQADILVTHEAPGCHRYGFTALDELARHLRVKQLYHGHQHDAYQAWLSPSIQVVGVAKRAVADLAGACVLAA